MKKKQITASQRAVRTDQATKDFEIAVKVMVEPEPKANKKPKNFAKTLLKESRAGPKFKY
jgi:hypothetical protein